MLYHAVPMTFPILQETDLPVPGSTCERSDIDFKGMVDSSEALELAKDIAALANTVGGSVVIGASTRGSQLLDYPGIAKKDAGKIPEAHEKAATDRCRPAPKVATYVVPRQNPSERERLTFLAVAGTLEPS